MNVEGMTRENVASHLQKYRLYLKKLAGISGNDPIPNHVLAQVGGRAWGSGPALGFRTGIGVQDRHWGSGPALGGSEAGISLSHPIPSCAST